MKQRGAYGRQNNELEDRNFEMTLLEENKMKRANRLDMIYGIFSKNKQ